MSERTPPSVFDRLVRLERANRRLQRLGAGMFLGIVAVVLMGQAVPRKPSRAVEAEEFVVRDQDGRVRAVLGPAAFLGIDGIGLRIVDPQGKLGIVLATAGDGTSSYLSLLGGNGKAGVTIGADPFGYSRLFLSKENVALAQLVVEPPRGDPRLRLLYKGKLIEWPEH